MESSSCPQKALTEEGNTLIVSTSGLNVGSDYVDIMIGRNDYGYSRSSSESAMMMSQIANNLFSEFPNATPGIIKKAIILGSNIRRSTMTDSRAGGSLSLDRTRKIIFQLLRNPSKQMKDIVKDNFWGYQRRLKLKQMKLHYTHF